MKLEVGKYYKTRNGRKVGPAKLRGKRYDHDGPFFISWWNYDDDGTCSNLGGDHDLDIVSEWVDEKDYLKADEKALDEGFGKKMPMLEVAPEQPQEPYPYEIATQYKIIVTVTDGDITITYDGRER